MEKKLTMIFWKGERFWLGKLLEHPEIMTQGETLEELEENLKDVFHLMALDDVPDGYEMKEGKSNPFQGTQRSTTILPNI
jgi:predicted RNase H-like HicB family nuclease